MEIANERQAFERLVQKVERVAKENHLLPIFGLEDSYGNGWRVASFLNNRGYKVKMVNPVLVERGRKYEAHPEKSDSLDALGVARVLIQRIDSLPDYSITPQEERVKDIQGLVSDREFMVKEQSRLKNHLHYLLHRSYGSLYKRLFKDPFSLKALRYWQEHPMPQSSLRDGLVKESTVLTNQIRRKIRRLLSIRQELKEIEEELRELLDQTGQKLQSMKGCAVVLTAQVVAEIRDIHRFKSPHKLAKYAGLAPRERSSGKSKRHTKTKSGNRRLNAAIHRIALSQIGRYGNEEAKAYFKRKISEGKSKAQALCSLKRRLVDIIYMILKHKKPYAYVPKQPLLAYGN